MGAGSIACGDDPAPQGPLQLPRDLPSPGVLMRLPASGGQARLYRIENLGPVDWEGPTSIPKIQRALGVDLDDQMVYAVTDDDEVVGIDLIARRSRSYLARASHLGGTADGVVLGLDSARRPLRFANRDLTTFRAKIEGGTDVRLVRAPGARMSAYSPTSRTLQVVGEEGELHRFEVPAGQLASSWFGDILAITTDSGLALVQPARDVSEFVRIKGTPLTSVFSPSSHRIYVARARGDLVIIDRFSRDEVTTIDLPGAARELRPDRSGRWLLARAENGDTVWVIDLVRSRLAGSLASPWATDLPVVTGGKTLIGRVGDDVVTWDLTGEAPVKTASLEGAAGDVFLALDWRPASLRPQVIAQTPPPADSLPQEDPAAEPEAAPAVESVRAPAPEGGEIYIQVTSSQNEGYAKALARQLSEIGFRARVSEPDSEGAGFRVLVGPYQSRDDAEADGRRLGRPYFITAPSSPEQ
jgi:hypothetical protein